MSKSKLEEAFAGQLRLVKIKAEREFKFHPSRRWKFDFCFPEHGVAVEIEGGIWVDGRHSRGSGMEADMSKYNEAAILGYRVLRVSGGHIQSGQALKWLEAALKPRVVA